MQKLQASRAGTFPRTVNDVLANRLAKYDVVDRLRSKPVSDADARRELNTGFRPKQGGSKLLTSKKVRDVVNDTDLYTNIRFYIGFKKSP
jgi:hypothetical protein